MSIRPYLIFLLGLSVFALFFWGPMRVQQKKSQKQSLIVVSSHANDWQKAFTTHLKQAGEYELELWEGMDGPEAFLSRWQSQEKKPEGFFVALGEVAMQSMWQANLPINYYGVQSYIPQKRKHDKGKMIGILQANEDYSLFFQNLKHLFPHINKWALVLSHNYSRLEAFIQQAYPYHLSFQVVKIFRFSELYLLSRTMDFDVQGILVLDDEAILEGIEKVVKASKKRDLPLVTVEPLTLLKGADLAIGVSASQQLKQLLEDLKIYDKKGKKLSPRSLQPQIWVSNQSLEKGRVKKENLQKLSLPLQQH